MISPQKTEDKKKSKFENQASPDIDIEEFELEIE